MLCSICKRINFAASPLHTDTDDGYDRWSSVPDALKPSDTSGRYFSYPHYSSIDELFKSATKGCHLCVQIRSELLQMRGHESNEKHHRGPLEIRFYPRADKVMDEAVIREIFAVLLSPSRVVKVPFDFVRYRGSLQSILREKASLEENRMGCEENMKLASIWLNRCLTKHGDCTMSTETLPALPSRVLDVNASESSPKLRLVDAKGKYGHYVTLSHCWGRHRIITTTVGNIREHMRAIPLSSLSQTFRDAISTVRSLNIPYIWIDSLCIIQDDPNDWAFEAAKMGSYYLNSLFNIAAVSASGGSEGCFMEYNLVKITPCPINIGFPAFKEYPNPDSAVFSGFLRPGMDRDPARDTDGYIRPKLWQRAWVLQERLLSPRLLLFSDTQMSWLCRTEEASERVPEGTSKFMDFKYSEKAFRSVLLGFTRFRMGNFSAAMKRSMENLGVDYSIGSEEGLTDLYNSWYDLVMLYGKCDLTVKSDIFPAISGIARGIGRATGDEYYAGHWKNDFHRGLLWTAPDSTVSKAELRGYRAPSWSWASIPATSSFFVRQILQEDVDTSCLELVEAQIQTETSDPFGQVRDGRLVVKGKLRKAHPYSAQLSHEEAFTSMRESDSKATLFDLRERISIGQYYPDNESMRYLPEIWCAPIMTERSYIKKKLADGSDLVIREARCWAMVCLDIKAHIFMRVGIAWIRDGQWFQNCSMSVFEIV